jgi:molybdopterin molybdotransferase
VQAGQALGPAGQQLTASTIGLLAAAGYQDVTVVRQPRVAILATGDEILAPGQPMVDGKLYASNGYTLAAWCLRFGFQVEMAVVQDDEDSIREQLTACVEQFDAVLTSGGAWKGEHDLIVHILDALGWRKLYHRVRIGPGKAVGFGLYQTHPVFCLPGGPPSNHMAYLQLALPGLQKLAGYRKPGLNRIPAVMAKTVSGQSDWTQFIHGLLAHDGRRPIFTPIKQPSRLQMLAQTDAVAIIPEGQTELPENSVVMAQLLDWPPGAAWI